MLNEKPAQVPCAQVNATTTASQIARTLAERAKVIRYHQPSFLEIGFRKRC